MTNTFKKMFVNEDLKNDKVAKMLYDIKID